MSSSFTKSLDSKVCEVKKINKFRSDYGRMNLHDRDIIKMAKKEGKKEIAWNMLADGLPTDAIAKYTGLSISEVTALQAEMTETA